MPGDPLVVAVERRTSAVLEELHGISRATVEAHYKLYQGFVPARASTLGA